MADDVCGHCGRHGRRAVTILNRAAARLDRLFGYGKPEPTRLGCGCVDDAHRYVCTCGHTACEQHRHDPHDCKEPAHA